MGVSAPTNTMSRNYPRLSIEEFGSHLLASNDLDPIYVALVECLLHQDYDQKQLARWLIAYWCFYHAGVASFLSEQEGLDFWFWMDVAAKNEQESPAGGRWPRGHERRHYRAKIAVDSVESLRQRYGKRPEEMVDYISEQPRELRGGELSLEAIPFQVASKRAQEHRGFGPWIGFKVADMVDRVLGIPVDFDEAAIFMFKDPEKAAIMLFEERHPMPEGTRARPKREVILSNVTNYLKDQFSGFRAPPMGDRPVNIQEVETVLCKWKSHMNGHYPLYNDIRDINTGLQDWLPASEAAQKFYAHMPKEKNNAG